MLIPHLCLSRYLLLLCFSLRTLNSLFAPTIMSRTADEELLATLGYKQEFTRAFSPLEVFGIAFSIIGLLPSIASVLVYAIPNGGASAMVRVVAFFLSKIATTDSGMGLGCGQHLDTFRRNVNGRACQQRTHVRWPILLDTYAIPPEVPEFVILDCWLYVVDRHFSKRPTYPCSQTPTLLDRSPVRSPVTHP